MSKARNRIAKTPPAPQIETKVESTGIFQRVSMKSKDQEGMKQIIRQAAEAATRAVDLDGQLDRIEAEAKAIIEAEKDRPEKEQHGTRDARDALFHVKRAREYVAKNNAKDAAAQALLLGYIYQRLVVRPFEGGVILGRELGYYWRGHWLKVTELERRILEFVGDADAVPLAELFRAAWHDDFRERDRGNVKKAMSGLNRRLTENEPSVRVTLHIRGDRVTVTSA